jgi:hypothetical protein
MSSNSDVQPSPSLQQQLSKLHELLSKTKQETCSEIHRVIQEQADEKKNRRVKKDADQDELRRNLTEIISEQEDETNRHVEDSAAGQSISVTVFWQMALMLHWSQLVDASSIEPLPILQEVHRKRLADLTVFVQGEYILRSRTKLNG